MSKFKQHASAFLTAMVLIISLLCSCNPTATTATETETPSVKETSLPTAELPTEENEGTTDSPVSEIVKLTFVSINDLHGAIEQDSEKKGGISNTAYLIDTLSDYYGDNDSNTTVRDDIILFGNGDLFQGKAISNITYGRAVIDAMNVMGFDGIGIGNHEFDWGIETILPYWDNSESNGEAAFPLVNSNIVYTPSHTLLGDISESDNVKTGIIVEKEGVKIGLISVIGPCKNSILASMVENYDFSDVLESVKESATALKALGAQLISVNIHYGEGGSNPLEYKVNGEIANLKGSDGKYLVDVIFNGHTHYTQSGNIARPDGSKVSVVQAGANNNAIGYITLTYNTVTDSVLSSYCGYKYVSDAGNNYDKEVQKVVDYYIEQTSSSKTAIAVSGVTISSKERLYNYVADIMVKGLGADYSASNQGGIRSTGGITAGADITEEMLYSIIPFDNRIYLITITGDALYRYYSEQQDYLYFGKSSSSPEWNSLQGSSESYTLAVIDYVYTGNYFNYRNYVLKEIDTAIMLRDLLVSDVTLFGLEGEKWTPYNGAKLTAQFHQK